MLELSYSDVVAAADRIAGAARRTPVLNSSRFDDEVGAEVYFKCENLQHVGAFKFRGAYNAIAKLTPSQRRAGVVTYSSGNHAQAIALAATMQGVSSTIVMPQDAPAIKRAATERYGAQIIEYDRDALLRLEPAISALAEAEDLPNHGVAVTVRAQDAAEPAADTEG